MSPSPSSSLSSFPLSGMKKNCRLCASHGHCVSAVSHSCPFQHCECEKCGLIKHRREVVAIQTRLRRAQKKELQARISRENSPSSSVSTSSCSPGIHSRPYHCQRCQNHGEYVSKKNHNRKCPWSDCPCSKCQLWTSRSYLDEELRRNNGEAGCSRSTQAVRTSALLPPTSNAVVNCLPSTSTTVLSSMLSSGSSLPLLPPNSIISSQFILDESIPIVDASLLPPGYLDACIANSQVEYITPTPLVLSSINMPFPFQFQ